MFEDQKRTESSCDTEIGRLNESAKEIHLRDMYPSELAGGVDKLIASIGVGAKTGSQISREDQLVGIISSKQKFCPCAWGIA